MFGGSSYVDRLMLSNNNMKNIASAAFHNVSVDYLYLDTVVNVLTSTYSLKIINISKINYMRRANTILLLQMLHEYD
jgi:hypothetical protein